MPAEPTALVCDVQRFSIHDGPGVRTTVFFKGCPLSCRWCQNPETIPFGNQLVYSARDCIGCGECVALCPQSAISFGAGRPVVDRSRCKICFTCVDACPGAALTSAARSVEPGPLLEEVVRDVEYYGSDGGVTLSGGEPLAQGHFLRSFLPLAREAGLHTTVETAGHWRYDELEPILGLVDLFLFDVKTIDRALHVQLTGRPNDRILTNLERLVATGRTIQVRMPVVPGHNDHRENLERTARLLQSLDLPTITLLAYHSLGDAKAAKIGAEGAPFGSAARSAGALEAASGVFSDLGIGVET